jgi:hypothetical protein
MKAAVVSAAIGVLVASCAIVAAPSSSPAQAECERQGGAWRAALGTCEKPGGGGGGGAM